MGDLGSIPGSGRSPGGEHGSPLQYSCLENPHGQRSRAGCSPRGLSRTRLSDLAQHSQRKKSALLGMVVTQMNARFKTHFTIHLSYVRFAFYTSKKKREAQEGKSDQNITQQEKHTEVQRLVLECFSLSPRIRVLRLRRDRGPHPSSASGADAAPRPLGTAPPTSGTRRRRLSRQNALSPPSPPRPVPSVFLHHQLAGRSLPPAFPDAEAAGTRGPVPATLLTSFTSPHPD